MVQYYRFVAMLCLYSCNCCDLVHRGKLAGMLIFMHKQNPIFGKCILEAMVLSARAAYIMTPVSRKMLISTTWTPSNAEASVLAPQADQCAPQETPCLLLTSSIAPRNSTCWRCSWRIISTCSRLICSRICSISNSFRKYTKDHFIEDHFFPQYMQFL